MGEGSQFYFQIELETIPDLRNLTDDADPEKDQNLRIGDQKPTLGLEEKQQIKVLVAEDDPINQKVAKLRIEALGYQVKIVSDGEIAVQTLQNNSFDIVLMDIQMPKLDGYEATKSIRSPATNVLNPNIPIIALTAFAIKGDAEKCLEAGMNDYISKPIQLDELVNAIEKWVLKKNINE